MFRLSVGRLRRMTAPQIHTIEDLRNSLEVIMSKKVFRSLSRSTSHGLFILLPSGFNKRFRGGLESSLFLCGSGTMSLISNFYFHAALVSDYSGATLGHVDSDY